MREPIGDYSFLCERALRRNNKEGNGFFENVADLIYFSVLGVSSPYLIYKNTNIKSQYGLFND